MVDILAPLAVARRRVKKSGTIAKRFARCLLLLPQLSVDIMTCSFSATTPLLRQIENLQNAHKSQATTWEKVEKNLTDRLSK